MGTNTSNARHPYQSPRLATFGCLSAVTLNGMGTKPEWFSGSISMGTFMFCTGGAAGNQDSMHYPCA